MSIGICGLAAASGDDNPSFPPTKAATFDPASSIEIAGQVELWTRTGVVPGQHIVGVQISDGELVRPCVLHVGSVAGHEGFGAFVAEQGHARLKAAASIQSPRDDIAVSSRRVGGCETWHSGPRTALLPISKP
ncbi:hypothetical protein OG920_28410 [Streptomyces europaeiscabiei]|nr:hypothetical protein OG858_28955 [Streptomyces europaeiscabiei]